jgi:ATP-dependent DNA ligase
LRENKFVVGFSAVSAATLTRIPAPFDHRDWLFELKYDGFRALAFIEDGCAMLISRNGHAFRGFESVRRDLAALPGPAVLDGELACVDRDGRPNFRSLFYRRGECHYFAFDVLFHRGMDVRALPLIERKRRLKRLIRSGLCVHYVSHISRRGIDFFNVVCAQDLEGIVAKRRDSVYGDGWLKIKNGLYSQLEGRRDFPPLSLCRYCKGPPPQPEPFEGFGIHHERLLALTLTEWTGPAPSASLHFSERAAAKESRRTKTWKHLGFQ